MGRSTNPREMRSSRGSVTEQEPKEVNQRRAEERSARTGGSSARRRRCSSASVASATDPPSHSTWVATSTLRKPCAPPPSGSWRTARCRPAVALNRVSRSRAASIHAATVAESGMRSWSTWPSRSLSRCSDAATSSAAASHWAVGGPGISMTRGTSTSAARAAASIRRTLPTGSSVSRTAISTAATSRPILLAAPSGPASWPAPPVTTTDRGAPKPRTSGRSVSRRTKLPTRSAYHSSRREP